MLVNWFASLEASSVDVVDLDRIHNCNPEGSSERSLRVCLGHEGRKSSEKSLGLSLCRKSSEKSLGLPLCCKGRKVRSSKMSLGLSLCRGSSVKSCGLFL